MMFTLDTYCHNSKQYVGMIDWCFRFLKSDFNRKFGVAPCHVDMMQLVLEDHEGWIKEDRCSCINAYRDMAKTTYLALGTPMYFCCNNGNIYWDNYRLPVLDYFVIKSKTAESAKKLLLSIQVALNSDEITDVYGRQIPTITEVKDRQGKSNSHLLITSGNRFIVEALGIGNPIRGTKILGRRPKFVIYDDVEHKGNTKTPESRNNNMEDLLGETLGAIDGIDGRIAVAANVVHEDGMIIHLRKNKAWRRRVYALSYIDKETKEEVSSWSQRFPMSAIIKKKKFYESQTKLGLKTFMKEYYNKIISDVRPIFKRDTEWQFLISNRVSFIKKNGVYKNLFVSVGYDPAQADKKDSSDSAIVVLGMDSDGKKYILDYFLGRLDLHDKYIENTEPVYPYALSQTDLDMIYQRGGIEEVLRYITTWNADAFCCETASQQRGIYNDIVDRLSRVTPDWLASKKFPGRNMRNVFGYPYTPHLDKVQKLNQSVMREFEAGKYTITTEKKEIKDIVETYPHCKLDLLDALFMAEQVIQKPLPIEYDPLDHTVHNKENWIPQFDKKCEEIWMVN